MADYERFALIFDSRSGELGRAALELIECGIDVLYVADPDEAYLLASQESGRLGAVIAPTSLGAEVLETLLTRVCDKLAGGSEALVPVGLEPDAEVCALLRKGGVRWCLWEPYGPRELRFVVGAAQAAKNPSERRKSLRVPIDVDGIACMGRVRKEVGIHDLSAGGAYLTTEHPFLPDSELSLDLPLERGTLVCKARVTNAKPHDDPSRPEVPNGMGVEFENLTPDQIALLGAFLEECTQVYRL